MRRCLPPRPRAPRDLCELGRRLSLPAWHGTSRRHVFVWYHCLQRLRLVEVEAGSVLTRRGEVGDTAYWLLTGEGRRGGKGWRG